MNDKPNTIIKGNVKFNNKTAKSNYKSPFWINYIGNEELQLNNNNLRETREKLSVFIKNFNETKETIENIKIEKIRGTKIENISLKSINKQDNKKTFIDKIIEIKNLYDLLDDYLSTLKKKVKMSDGLLKNTIQKIKKSAEKTTELDYEEIVKEKLELGKDIQLLQILSLNSSTSSTSSNSSFPNLIGYDLDYFNTNHNCISVEKLLNEFTDIKQLIDFLNSINIDFTIKIEYREQNNQEIKISELKNNNFLPNMHDYFKNEILKIIKKNALEYHKKEIELYLYFIHSEKSANNREHNNVSNSAPNAKNKLINNLENIFKQKYNHLLDNFKTFSALYNYLKNEYKKLKLVTDIVIKQHNIGTGKNKKLTNQQNQIQRIENKYNYKIIIIPIKRIKKPNEQKIATENQQIQFGIITKVLKKIPSTTINKDINSWKLDLIEFTLEYKSILILNKFIEEHMKNNISNLQNANKIFTKSLYCNKKKHEKNNNLKYKIHKYVLLGKKLAEAITGDKSSLFDQMKSWGKNTSQYNLFKRYIGATEKRNATASWNPHTSKILRWKGKPLTINRK